MRLQDIMSREMETISPEASVVLANELMWRKRIHHLVVTQGDQVVGVISDSDLGGEQTDSIPDDKQVKHYMTAAVVSEGPTTTVDRAINIFRERKIHCLPVLENGKLVGIVTDTDIYNLASRGLEAGGPYPPLQNLRGQPIDQS